MEGRARGGGREGAGVVSEGESGPGRGRVTRASKSPQRFGWGRCGAAENGDAHLVIEKMEQVMTERSLASSHDEDNG